MHQENCVNLTIEKIKTLVNEVFQNSDQSQSQYLILVERRFDADLVNWAINNFIFTKDAAKDSMKCSRIYCQTVKTEFSLDSVNFK